MPTYRLYCLDGQGKITAAEWIEAANDDAALIAARALAKPAPCELWLRDKMIQRIEPAKA